MSIKWRARLDRKDLQKLLSQILEICMQHDMILWWDHLPGKYNTIADKTSRFKNEPFAGPDLKNILH